MLFLAFLLGESGTNRESNSESARSSMAHESSACVGMAAMHAAGRSLLLAHSSSHF